MKTTIIKITLMVLLSMSICNGQQDTTWKAWNWLLGEWIGEGSGTPGQATGWFSLYQDLAGKILIRKNHAEYPAVNNKPQTVHDDLMIIYHGYSGNEDKAIYFDNEGHTINYTISYSDRSIVLTSVKVPAMPVFRLTYDPLENGLINVKFEMSQDGEKFMTYTEGKCKRK